MMFSVFTPTHNAQHLKRLADSLQKQTVQDFEWVVLINGDVKEGDIPYIPQLRVIKSPMSTDNIGWLKNYVCTACKGDILIEVDHDDEVTPDCLEELLKASDETNADFFYSNCASVNADWSPHTYSSKFGWEYRDFIYEGKTIKEAIAFRPDPATFSRIWYGPNHVRAWKKSFYDSIGGHNYTMDVLDDQELFIRSYLKGKVHWIDKCLYVYHVHPNNTCYGEKNSRIQVETVQLHNKYIYQLTEKWSDDNGLRKIDLCGGHNPPKGYESVDVENGDITADLNKKWSWAKDNSVGVIRAHDALEHLKNPIHVMKEAWRVLHPNGYFLIEVPSTDGRGAFQDPTHVSFWNSNSFWYYTKAQTAKYINTPVRFQLMHIENHFPSEFHKTHNILYTRAHLVKLDEVNSYRPCGLIQI